MNGWPASSKTMFNDGALWTEAAFAPAHDVRDPGIGKNGGVELYRLLGVAVEPEVRSDLLSKCHCSAPVMLPRCGAFIV